MSLEGDSLGCTFETPALLGNVIRGGIVIELVWDSVRLGTGTGPSGSSLIAGEGAAWSPDDLLAMAAASCLMRTFLRLAAEDDVPVLGYVTSATLEFSSAESPAVRVRPCIVVPIDIEPEQVLSLCRRVTEVSPVAKVLAGRLAVEPDVCRVTHDQERAI
jgi:organic hydroperoxide reductase OsmC/OhrA